MTGNGNEVENYLNYHTVDLFCIPDEFLGQVWRDVRKRFRCSIECGLWHDYDPRCTSSQLERSQACPDDTIRTDLLDNWKPMVYSCPVCCSWGTTSILCLPHYGPTLRHISTFFGLCSFNHGNAIHIWGNARRWFRTSKHPDPVHSAGVSTGSQSSEKSSYGYYLSQCCQPGPTRQLGQRRSNRDLCIRAEVPAEK